MDIYIIIAKQNGIWGILPRYADNTLIPNVWFNKTQAQKYCRERNRLSKSKDFDFKKIEFEVKQGDQNEPLST